MSGLLHGASPADPGRPRHRVARLALAALASIALAIHFAWSGHRPAAQHIIRIVEIELAAALDLEPLIALQRELLELLELKSRVLEDLTSGAIHDHSLCTSLSSAIDAARDHVGELLLHVRAGLEEETSGGSAASRAIWSEAAERSRDAEGEPT